MFNILKKGWVWAVKAPSDIDIIQHVGKWVKVEDDNHKEIGIQIEEIVGSLAYPTKFQITARGKQYLISMLDFFAQMNGEKIDKETIRLFDETQFEVKQTGDLGWLKKQRVAKQVK